MRSREGFWFTPHNKWRDHRNLGLRFERDSFPNRHVMVDRFQLSESSKRRALWGQHISDSVAHEFASREKKTSEEPTIALKNGELLINIKVKRVAIRPGT